MEFTNLGTGPAGQLVQIDVADANLENVRFSYQAGDKGFRLLEPMAGRPNVFCIPSQAVCTGLVQVVAEDLAGNQTVQQMQVSQMKTTRGQAVGVNTQPTPEPKTLTPGAPNNLPKDLGAVPPITSTETHQVQKMTPQTPDRQGMSRPNGSEGPRWTDDEPSETTKSESPRDVAWTAG